MDEIANFEAARTYIESKIKLIMETFFPFATNAFNSCTIIRETEKLIKEDLVDRFPLFPDKYLPRCKFRMHSVEEEKFALEYNIQNYLNKDYNMKYLGSCGIGKSIYDLYCRHSFDPRFDIMFYSRHGHQPEEFSIGSKTAEAEYHLGVASPLAVAYGMAIQDGIIPEPIE